MRFSGERLLRREILQVVSACLLFSPAVEKGRESYQPRVEEDGGGLKKRHQSKYYRSLHSALCRSLFEIRSAYILPFMVMLRITSGEHIHAVHAGRKKK